MLSHGKEVRLILFVTVLIIFFFFFQAEDGIRDYKVTGVQTCALPIYHGIATYALAECAIMTHDPRTIDAAQKGAQFIVRAQDPRSEERRVGKECRSRWSPYH